MADCWSCILLKQENPKLSLTNIVNKLKEARKISHNNQPDDMYSTYNSLDRLLINIKNFSINNPHDVANLVQLSAQQGLIKNFDEIINTPKFKDLRSGLKKIMGNDIPVIVNNTIKRLKI